MSTYSPNLRIELIDSGSQAGVWGTTTNTNLGTLIEQSVSGYVSVSIIAASQALTAVNGATDQSRMAMIRLTTTTGAAFSVFVPPSPKQYIFKNASGQTATIVCSSVLGNTTPAAGGTTIVIPDGATMSVWSDGTNISLQNQNSVTPTVGTNNTQVATTAFVQAAVRALYPVGSIYISTVATNPAATFGFGTWSAYGGGKVLVGYLSGDTLFGTGGQLQGSANTPVITHTHNTSAQNGTHNHAFTGGGIPNHQHDSSWGESSSIPDPYGLTPGRTNVRGSGDTDSDNRGWLTSSAIYTGGTSGVNGIANNPVVTGTNAATLVGTPAITVTNPVPDGTVSTGTNTNYQPSITVYMWQRDS